jgi:hypothetical protein
VLNAHSRRQYPIFQANLAAGGKKVIVKFMNRMMGKKIKNSQKRLDFRLRIC